MDSPSIRPREPQRAREQHGVDDVRRDAHEPGLEKRRSLEHQKAAANEPGDAERRAADVDEFQRGVVQASCGACEDMAPR